MASVNNRCSIGAYGVFLGHNLVFWLTSKQRIVSHSSIVSENIVMFSAMAELL